MVDLRNLPESLLIGMVGPILLRAKIEARIQANKGQQARLIDAILHFDVELVVCGVLRLLGLQGEDEALFLPLVALLELFAPDYVLVVVGCHFV